jgi:hypothetical protein
MCLNPPANVTMARRHTSRQAVPGGINERVLDGFYCCGNLSFGMVDVCLQMSCRRLSKVLLFGLLVSCVQCIQLVSSSLTAQQLARSLRCIATQHYKPTSWWLVKMLALTHARADQFTTTDASALLYAAGKLSHNSQLPSSKWSQDLAQQFWKQLSAANALQLSEGLWGAVAVGVVPSEQQWQQWEEAVEKLGWQLSLQQARNAVMSYRQLGRPVPSGLLGQLQSEYESMKALKAAEVAAAEAARQAAAQQLVMQQQRAAEAVAMITQHYQQQQQPPAPASRGNGNSAGRKGRGKQRHMSAAGGSAASASLGGHDQAAVGQDLVGSSSVQEQQRDATGSGVASAAVMHLDVDDTQQPAVAVG